MGWIHLLGLSLVLVGHDCVNNGLHSSWSRADLVVRLAVTTMGNSKESAEARMPALYALDGYDACLRARRGPYCLAQLTLHDDKPNHLIDFIREHSDYFTKHFNHSVISRGVCVQETCGNYPEATKTGEVQRRALAACLNESIWREYGVQADVSLIYYCDDDNESDDVTPLDWTVLAVFIAIVAINIAATCYDVYVNKDHEKDQGNHYILSFSIIRNYKWLTSNAPNPKTDNLQFINCIRVLVNFFVIMAHAMLIVGSGFTRNSQDYEKFYDSVFYQIIYNGMMIVQIFFFISGLLLAHNFLIQAETKKPTWFDVPLVMFLRSMRLTPSLAVVLAFSATWLRHIGSGPLWKLFITHSVVTDCRAYWWHHLLYFNNYMQGDKNCLLQTWHIAADTQLYLVGVVLCVCISPRRQRLVLGALLALGTALPALQVWLQDLDPLVIMHPEFYRTLENKTFRAAHVVGHDNLQCFVVGMLVAYLVHDCQRKGVDFSKNKYFSLYLWMSPALVLLTFYSGQVFYAEGPRAPLLVRALYAGAHRLLLAAVCALAALGLLLNAPSAVRTLAEWRGWALPSRLSYGVYLLHMNMVHVAMASRKQLVWVSTYNLLSWHLGIVCLSYILAVPLFLMVEAPVNRLVNNVRDQRTRTQILSEKNKDS